MKPQGMTSGYAFAGNPVIYRETLDTSHSDEQIRGGSYRVRLGEETIYEGKFSLPVSINLSELLSGEADEIVKPSLLVYQWVFPVTRTGRKTTLSMTVEYDNGADWESLPVEILRGRIPSAEYFASSLGSGDIFTARFLNPEANFFMTGRTTELLLEIPETEIYPLCFIMPGGKGITVEAGGKTYESGILPRGIYWLNLAWIRKDIYTQGLDRQLVSEFLVGHSDSDCRVRVVITRVDPAVSRVRLRYRNYFDIPELMAFSGTLSANPVLDDDQDREYLQYARYTDDYELGKNNSTVRLALSLDTGEVAARDIHRLIELLASRSVHLESPVDGSWLPVTVSAGDDFSFPLRPETPLSFNLSLTLAKEDLSLLSLLKPESAEPWRIFSVEHNDRFI